VVRHVEATISSQMARPRSHNSDIRLPEGLLAGAVWLLRPRIRYSPAARTSAPANGTALVWHPQGTAAWVASDSTVEFQVELMSDPVSSAFDRLHFSVTARRPLRVSFCSLSLAAECSSPPQFLDSCLRWRSLNGTENISELTPLLVRFGLLNGSICELRALKSFLPCRVSWIRSRLILEVILDAAALHPRWKILSCGRTVSTAAPLWQPGHKLGVDLLCRRELPSAPRVFLGRYPEGKEAALILTDHCDHDSAEKLRLLLDGHESGGGWCGRGLRMTKGVFSLPSRNASSRSVPTLADENYRFLIQKLHLDGSEIAPHALTEHDSPPLTEFQRALDALARGFSSRSWIDHGHTLTNTYYAAVGDRPDNEFLGTLRRFGFLAIWAYHDSLAEASQSLNMLVPPHGSVRALLRRSFQYALAGRSLVALHYLRTFFRRNIFSRTAQCGARLISDVRRLVRSFMTLRECQPGSKAHLFQGFFCTVLQGLRCCARVKPLLFSACRDDPSMCAAADQVPLPFSRCELSSGTPVCYPERAVPLNQAREDDLMLFTTMEVVHPGGSYNPEALARLVAEHGLHIGHCYLLNTLPYLDGLFKSGSEPLELTFGWVAFVTELTRYVSDCRLWNPAVSELVSWLRSLQGIHVRPIDSGSLELENQSSSLIKNCTLMLDPSILPDTIVWSRSAPAGYRCHEDWLAVWGDIPPRQKIQVTWSSHYDSDSAQNAKGVFISRNPTHCTRCEERRMG